MTLNLSEWLLVKVMTHSLDKNQSLCEVRTSNVSPYIRFWPDTNFALFLQVTLTLPEWLKIKVMTDPQAISNLCWKKDLPVFFHKKDINRTRILYRHMDRQKYCRTDGRKDKVIPIYIFKRLLRGYKKLETYMKKYMISHWIVLLLWPERSKKFNLIYLTCVYHCTQTIFNPIYMYALSCA